MGSVAVKNFVFYYQDYSTDSSGMKCEHEVQWNDFILHLFTLIINQQMHYIKFHIKTLTIAPTCFDPKIILRELRCSLLK